MYILWEIIKFILNVLAITTIVDIILMGPLLIHFEKKAKHTEFFVTPRPETVKTENGTYFEFQGAGGCAGFSSAFVLRHMGNLAALQNELARGNPVIVVIRSFVGKSFLHFACITGYDEENIYFADSIKDWVNVESPKSPDGSELYYNRIVPLKEFKKLWNTSMLKMPFYFNIYYKMEKPEK